mgnify:CR=1 FL=1
MSDGSGPAVPAAHPRPLVLQPPDGRPADARPPGRRHDGHHGQPRPDHGRGRQVSALSRPWSRLTLAGKIVLPLLALFAVLTMGLLVGCRRGAHPVPRQTSAATRSSPTSGIVRFVVAATAILLLHRADRLHDHLPRDEGHRAHEPPYRTEPRRAVGHAAVDHPRLQGAGARRTSRRPAQTCRSSPWRRPSSTWPASWPSWSCPSHPGLVGADMNIGLLYFFAVGGLGVVGLMMAGWSSFNKYSAAGRPARGGPDRQLRDPADALDRGCRAACRARSASTRIVVQQSGSFLDWFVFRQPLGFLIFFIAAAAEASRTPFDLTEADSEIVAGFATEYSGMRFGFFFFAEYVNVFLLSALTVVLFLGGWNAPVRPGRHPGPDRHQRRSCAGPRPAGHRAAVRIAHRAAASSSWPSPCPSGRFRSDCRLPGRRWSSASCSSTSWPSEP